MAFEPVVASVGPRFPRSFRPEVSIIILGPGSRHTWSEAAGQHFLAVNADGTDATELFVEIPFEWLNV